MKTRKGFVSNSSSSSFIISAAKSTEKKCYSVIDVVNLMAGYSNEDYPVEIHAEGTKEVIEYMQNSWYSKDDIKEVKAIKDEVALVTVNRGSSIALFLQENSYKIFGD
jgi:hypothetical protein